MLYIVYLSKLATSKSVGDKAYHVPHTLKKCGGHIPHVPHGSGAPGQLSQLAFQLKICEIFLLIPNEVSCEERVVKKYK